MKIIFLNGCGNGDLHYTRNFVKDIMSKMSGNEFYYFHKQDNKVLLDIGLKQPDNRSEISSRGHYFNTVITKKEMDIIYIHTWIGLKDMKYHAINYCSLYSNYEMYKDIYRELNIELGTIDHYIPTIDYSFFNIENIKEFTNNDKKKILICNGDVRSGQVPNFSFKPVIENLSEKFQNVHFFLTDKCGIEKDNVFYTDQFKKDDGSDLNEISYLSTKCDIIVGRASGPYCFTHVKENMLNTNKTFMSFCNTYSEGIFYDAKKSKNIWSNDYKYESIYDKIEKEINEKINIL